MLSLSAVARREKNKLSTDSSFIPLLEIKLPNNSARICYNTEDVTWNGELYQAFPFEIGEVREETDGSDPNVTLTVDNTSQALQYMVEESRGGNGFPVIIRVVNSENLDAPEPELEEYFVVTKTEITQESITFTLGNEYSSRTRRPLNRYMKNNCPFRYKGIRCGCTSAEASCNHTLTDCRARSNSERFGGFQGIDQKGVYVHA
jgi:phage minor tail protein L|nr:MAG TPA: minor tail protein L [Caudoviricetes sp.]